MENLGPLRQAFAKSLSHWSAISPVLTEHYVKTGSDYLHAGWVAYFILGFNIPEGFSFAPRVGGRQIAVLLLLLCGLGVWLWWASCMWVSSGILTVSLPVFMLLEGGEFLWDLNCGKYVDCADLSLIKAIITSDFCSTSVWALVMMNVFEVF